LPVLPFCAVPASDVQPPEEAVSLASVLQELTSAALDLFDPEGLLDDFLQRLTLRLGCLAALCLELSQEGRVLLLGSAGLSRASRELPLTVQVEPQGRARLSEVNWGALSFPYPELTATPLGLWQFPFTTAPEEQSPPAALLLFFEPSQRVSQQYFGLVARLMKVVRRALHHRGLDVRVRQSEQRLIEQKRLLEAEVVDNARLYEEAQQAIRIREEFLSVAAHELFTPLTSLRLAAQSLQRTPSAQACPSRSLLQIIDGQTRRLSRLVSELLDVSRIQAGALALEFDEIDLGQMTQEVVEQFGPELERSGTPLKLKVEPGVTGWWDRLRLEQVLQNLLSNAVKYGERKPIEVQVKAEDGMACLVVRDHGMGISPEDQARIFGPFERAISSRHFGGLGLGLYIAQRIVWQLGGSIRLHSEPGQGAAFTVELPRAGGSAQRTLPTGPEALH